MLKKLIITGLAGVVCIAYYFSLTFFNIGIPCFFHKFTGLLCPGCGITRMILAILHLDFKSAFQYNQVVFIFSPIILYFIIRLYVSWLKSENYKLSLIENIVVYIMLTILLIFGIIRNII